MSLKNEKRQAKTPPQSEGEDSDSEKNEVTESENDETEDLFKNINVSPDTPENSALNKTIQAEAEDENDSNDTNDEQLQIITSEEETQIEHIKTKASSRTHKNKGKLPEETTESKTRPNN